MKSPLSISYNDLINYEEKRLAWMEKEYPSLKSAGRLSEWTATHNKECQKMIIKLLKKAKREPQLDLFKAFEKIKN